MEFIDKFRFNAKLATLVQSCVKMVDRWIWKHLQKLKLKPNGLSTFGPIHRHIIAINDAYFVFSKDKEEDDLLQNQSNATNDNK